MPLHLFTSSNPDQRFQPGCAAEMTKFFGGEALVEDDAVAAELDSLIAKGRIPEIKRLNIGDKVAELEAAEAKAAGLRHVLANLQGGGVPSAHERLMSAPVVGVTTTAGMPQASESVSGSAKNTAKQAN